MNYESREDVIIECVKLMDGNGYKVQLVRGEDVVSLDHFNFGNIARNFADSVAQITGYSVYLVKEIYSSTVVNSVDEFDRSF